MALQGKRQICNRRNGFEIEATDGEKKKASSLLLLAKCSDSFAFLLQSLIRCAAATAAAADAVSWYSFHCIILFNVAAVIIIIIAILSIYHISMDEWPIRTYFIVHWANIRYTDLNLIH